MSFSRGPNIVTDGLVLALDATSERSYTSGSLVWEDISGNNNHAYLTYSGSDTASFDEKMNWSGSGDFRYFAYTPLPQTSSVDHTSGTYWTVNGNDSLSPNVSGEWTVMGWTKHNGEPEFANGTGWFVKGNGDQGIHIEFHGGSRLRVNTTNATIPTGSGWETIRREIPELMYEWHHWAVTFSTNGSYGTDDGNLRLYIDGELDTEKRGIPKLDVPSSPILLGRRNGHNRHYQTADVSSYLYYTRELSGTEVKQNYNSHKSRFNL